MQRAGYETEYVLNFYVKSGGAPEIINPATGVGTGNLEAGSDWQELGNNMTPQMTIRNRGRVDVNVPVKWHTNETPQFGPAILDTEAAPGPTGGYRKAQFQTNSGITQVDDGDIMTWDSNLGSWINKPGNSVGAGVMQFEYKLDTDSDTGFVTTLEHHMME